MQESTVNVTSNLCLLIFVVLQIVKLPDGTEEAVVKRTPEERHRSPFTLSLNR